jgi:hypothetical protein
MGEWVNHRVRPSAGALVRVSHAMALLLLLVVLVSLGGLAIRAVEAALVVSFWALCIAGFAYFTVIASVWVAAFAEERRGYTTLARHFRHVPQIDPQRGTVVREAGAAFTEALSTEEGPDR